jgi:poly(3-hydroxybutyrate) depolymerase
MWYTMYDRYARLGRQYAYGLQQWRPVVQDLLNKVPGNMWSSWIMARNDWMERFGREYPKPEFGIQSVKDANGARHAVNHAVVRSTPFVRWLEFTTLNPDIEDQSLVIVAPLSGHYATLLRDTVKTMLGHYRRVVITDWENARDIPITHGTFSLNDYVLEIQHGLQGFSQRMHVMAVCQPVVPVLAAAALMAKNNDPLRPLSLTLIGGPIDARKSPTSVNNYATNHSLDWFRQHVIDAVPTGYAGAGKRVYPGFLQHFGFVAMNPQRHAKSYHQFFYDLLKGDHDDIERHRRFYDEYNAVLDLDEVFYLDTIEHVFQKFSLANNTFEVNGELADVTAIKDIAIFTIEGENDDISGVGQTQAALPLCSSLPASLKHSWIVPGVGHYGVFSGSAFRNDIGPAISAWHRKLNTKRTVRKTR